MTDKTEMVSVPREWLNRVSLLQMPLDELQDQAAELLAAPAEDARAVVDEPVAWKQAFDEWYSRNPYDDLTHATVAYMAFQAGASLRHPQRQIVSQCSEVSPQCSEQLRTQGKLLPSTLLPHPPRHWGFLQPEREVPGYTIEQMKEYGALCAAEALRQNK